MLSHANRLHGCCRITSFSNDTGDSLVSSAVSQTARCCQHLTSGDSPLPRDDVCLERFARNRGKGGGESCVCAAACPLKEKPV